MSECQLPAVRTGCVFILVLCVVSVIPTVSHAEVTASGLGTVVNQPSEDAFDITGGTRPDGGRNLFHSFGDFSLDADQSSNFQNDSGLATENILSRVTGGNVSNILGTINTTDFAGANLFLMNPAGIVFGPSAQLNVDGSFHATTADYIRLGSDGGIFYADPTQPTLLTVAEPSAFGFLNSNPASIEVQTGGLGEDLFPTSLLQVAEGETLSLVGGDISLGAPDASTSGFLLAPGGTVNLASVASPGEATFNSPINTDGFNELGDISISGGSLVDGRDVFIRSGQLTIDDGFVWPGVFSLFGLAPAPDGGEVNVDVRNDVTLTGTGPDPFLGLAAPGIFTFSGELFDIPVDETKVPDITVNTNTLSSSGIFSGIQNLRAGPGTPGDIDINANTVRVEEGGLIALQNFYEGFGGNLAINAQQVDIDGPSAGLFAQGLLNFFALCNCDPGLTFADSGAITLNVTDTLSVTGGAQISTLSGSFGSGGDLTIDAGNIVTSGRGGVIDSQSFYAGPSGNLTINADQIEINDGFVIGNNTVGTGQAGVLEVNARDSINISGTASGMAAQTFPPGDFELNIFANQLGFPDYPSLLAELGLPADTGFFELMAFLDSSGFTDLQEPLVAGNGGSLRVSTPDLRVDGTQSAIDSGTAWDGNGGEIQLDVGSLDVSGGAEVRSRSGIFLIETGELVVGTGNAGAVNIDATDSITVSGTDSDISTSTFGDGDGGNVSLDAANRIKIEDGGSVSADSTGGGLTGNISIRAGDEIRMKDGSVTTAAETSDGGNIELRASEIIHLTDSTVSTSVESGVGGGGNIDVDPEFVVLNDSDVIANAFGGPGGNITIVAENFVPSADSVVEASSELGVQGRVVIESPDNDLASQVVQLPSAYLETDDLLPERCEARRSGAGSSFVIFGDGGLPTDPDGYLPSFGALGNVPAKADGSAAYLEPDNDGAYTWVRGVTLAFLDPGCR